MQIPAENLIFKNLFFDTLEGEINFFLKFDLDLGSNEGKLCVDIDECNLQSSCPPNSRCINEIGDYSCECSEGFSEGQKCSGSECKNFECSDFDECSAENRRCEQVCINTPGSFHCECFEDYRNFS